MRDASGARACLTRLSFAPRGGADVGSYPTCSFEGERDPCDGPMPSDPVAYPDLGSTWPPRSRAACRSTSGASWRELACHAAGDASACRFDRADLDAVITAFVRFEMQKVRDEPRSDRETLELSLTRP